MVTIINILHYKIFLVFHKEWKKKYFLLYIQFLIVGSRGNEEEKHFAHFPTF